MRCFHSFSCSLPYFRRVHRESAWKRVATEAEKAKLGTQGGLDDDEHTERSMEVVGNRTNAVAAGITL